MTGDVSQAIADAVKAAKGPDGLPKAPETITPEEARIQAEEYAKLSPTGVSTPEHNPLLSFPNLNPPVVDDELKVLQAEAQLITDPDEVAKLIPEKPAFIKMYLVTVDAIVGNVEIAGYGPGMVRGRVSDADLEAANVDKAWLLKTGAIVEDGWAPVA